MSGLLPWSFNTILAQRGGGCLVDLSHRAASHRGVGEGPLTTHRRPWMDRRCTQIGPFKRLRFFGAESGAKDIDGLRLRTDINRRPERCCSGHGTHEARGGQGVPRSGERSQDRPRAASPLVRPARRRRRGDGDAARPAGAIHPRPVEHPPPRSPIAKPVSDRSATHGPTPLPRTAA
jgi:hypothetical protein